MAKKGDQFSPRKARQLLLVQQVFLIIFLPCLVPVKVSGLNVSIGFLSCPQDHLTFQTEQDIYSALQMAVNEANQQLTKNLNLAIAFKKVEVNQSITVALEEMLKSGAVTVFGHNDICSYITSALKSRNRIAISNVCGDEKLSNKELFPAFLRTRPPDSQMVESMLMLLQHYAWNSISLVVQNTSKWHAIADSFERRIGHKEGRDGYNITVHHTIYFEDNRLCCALRQPCCYGAWPHNIFEKIKSSSKIYVFLGETMSLRIFIQAIEDQELWQANQYLVISCDEEAFSTSWAISFLQSPREMQKEIDSESHNWDTNNILTESRKFYSYSNLVENSWLVDVSPSTKLPSSKDDFRAKTTPGTLMVIRNTANEHLNAFTRRLRRFSSKQHHAEEKVALPSSIYAAYAYDAIMVFVQALKFHMQKNGLNEMDMADVALNGSLLYSTIMEIQNFSSSRGGFISFDANGDTEDSYIAVGSLDLFTSKANSSVDVPRNVMIPFGYFRGTVFVPSPTVELNNQTVQNRLTLAENPYDIIGYDAELLNENINVTMVVTHILTLVAMAYTFAYQTRKLAAKMDILTIKVTMSTDAELCAHLLDVKQMRVMNYNTHPNKVVDDWRMKVWYKSLKLKSSWPALNCETIGEIRRIQRFQHDNVNPFICAIIEPARICLITEFQPQNSLLDVLSSPNNNFSCKMVASLALDLVSGMHYIHSTKLQYHGNLKSSNCLIDSNWNLKVADFGLHELRDAAKDPSENEKDYYFNLLWTAPEILRDGPPFFGTPEGDVYSFAIILHEMVCRQGPFAICYDLDDHHDPIRIVNQVKQIVRGCQMPMRPPMETPDSNLAYMFPCMIDCWTEDPNERPEFSSVLNYLSKLEETSLDFTHKKSLLSDDDACIEEKKRALKDEIQRIDDVLHRIIPKSVADCLANGLPVESELWENVTVFEADLVGFTAIASETTPLGTMILLDDVYTLFDSIARGYDVCKIGTIGDAYIVVSGIHSSNEKNSAGEIASMALEVVEKMKNSGIEHRGKPLVVRIGVHTGQLMTGVVGSSTMPTYSIFGDTVSIASRMESTSSELRIQISEASYQALQQIGGYITEERNDSPESFKTYWLIGKTSKAVQRREKVRSGERSSLCNRQSIISLTSTDIVIDHSTENGREM